MASVLKVANAVVVTGYSFSNPQQCPAGDQIAVGLNITAVSGTTPSMTVNVIWTQDGTNYLFSDPADAFSVISAVTTAVKTFARKGIGFQLLYVLTGTTPSFTVTATAVPVGSGNTY